MKKAIAITALALAAPLAQAEYTPMDKAMCTQVSRLAGRIMIARQNNVPRASLMASMADPEVQAVARNWVERAYAQPRYTLKKHKIDAVRDFMNGAYMGCFDALG